MSNPYTRLFSPLTLGGHRLRNRVALPATLTNFGTGNRVSDRWTNFLVERARGGCALLVSEIIAVDPEALAHGAIVTGYDPGNEDGFRRTATGVETAGGVLVGQLWHPGRQQLWHPTRSPQGVSEQPDALSWTVPHVMDSGQLARLEHAFVDAAVRLAACGFHGVELHGAHGYLLTQLLSPWSNDRDDDYGGSRENRARFVRQVAEQIRERCGDDFIVGLKMPADEGVEGGIDPDEAEGITAHLATHGVLDYFAYGQGNFSRSLENHVPDLHFRPGHYIDLHRRMRGAAGGKPVMALGRIGSPALAERVVAEGYGDLVGMSRTQIADAAFANKAREGREADIRPCVFNNSSWGEVHAGKPLAEFHNPHLGEDCEAQWAPAVARDQKRVVVVGAGPGGLEAAWVAAARGHRVTLVGTRTEPGGKLRLEARLPGHAEMDKVCQHQLHLAKRHGVELLLGQTADADSVLGLDPDVAIVATGAGMRAPETLSVHGHEMLSAHSFAANWEAGTPPRRGTAVLYDHDHTAATYAVAEALALSHDQLVLITPRTQIAQAVNYCSALGIHRRLYNHGAEIITASEPLSWHDGVVTLSNVFSGHQREITNVVTCVYATPRRARDTLLRDLSGRVAVHGVGDCVAPRNLLIAIHEGHHVANTL
jgi:2,4-dienoyl-CoA reductase-like NADH-dependent reductase (Old Yellow Enzyme family)